MRRIKFSLRGLILLFTCVVLFLGVSQYRRREILKVCAELKREGYVFSVPAEWRDYFFQRKPVIGTVRQVGERTVLARAMNWEDGNRWGTILDETDDHQEIERLKNLGVVDFR